MSGRRQAAPLARRASDRVDVDVVLASGLVLSDACFTRPAARSGAPSAVPGERWVLVPGATSCLIGDRLTVSFEVLPDDVSHTHGRVWVARTRRTVEVTYDGAVLTRLLAELTSGCTVDELADRLPQAEVGDLLADLAAWEAVVAESVARPLLSHLWSMRGARGRARLSPAEIADLTFSPQPCPDDGTVIPLADVGPFPVDSLATVLRRRRSPTRYDGRPISIDELGQLLGGACGVTGELLLEGRSLPLRAYPSPGALYAVDTYVVPAQVDGLTGGAFRYDPVRHALVEVDDRPVDPASFCLPDVRAVVAGVAAFIALAIRLPRATPKYGDECYRILVAEAGCIAQNLLLVAYALGLRAGPFTGTFDALVDQAILRDPHQGGFVVGVLVGHEEEPA